MPYSVKDSVKEDKLSVFNIYWYNDNKQLGKFVATHTDYEEAIIAVKQHLIRAEEGWNSAVLACLQGGKK